MQKSLPSRSCFLLATAAVAILAPRSTFARPYTLDELLELARKNSPTLSASEKATEAVEAQLLEAQRMRLPSGDLSTILAPTPEIRCTTATPPPSTWTGSADDWRLSHCDGTSWSFDKSRFADALTNLSGVFTRTELKLVQPVYTFGKIASGIAAGEAGVRASRHRERGARAEIELLLHKAYYGAKLARESLATLEEGLGYIEQAQKKVDQDLAEGTGESSVVDRLRLRTVRAEVEGRVLEAKRMASIATSGLRALIGPAAPADLEVDAAPLAPVTVADRPLQALQEDAVENRPELKAMEELVNVKQALAEVEWKRQYPDLVLIGTAQFAYASKVDHPQNAFANDPFNSSGIGLAAALRMPLDIGVRNAKAHRLKAEAEETAAKRREAQSGIGFEVEKAHSELQEATARLIVLQKGEKAARQWIAALSQNNAVGMSEPKEYTDALLAYFKARMGYLQAIFDFNLSVAALARATGLAAPVAPSP
jgi:outer membrane protein